MTNDSPTRTTPPPLPASLGGPVEEGTRHLHDPTAPSGPESARFELEDLLTGKNLFRLGLGLLLLGFVFLFRHAIEENWIGPGARVAAGAITSALLLGAGLRIDSRRPTYGQLLQGGGVAGLYLTAFAAHRVYGMIDETAAFAQLALVSMVGVGLAIQARSQLLATVSIVGALAAPLLIGGRMVAFGGDALYVIVVLAATTALFLRFEWQGLWWATQVGVVLMAVGDLVRLELDLATAPSRIELQTVLVALWLTFYLVPVVMHAVGRLIDALPAQLGTGLTTLFTFGMSYLVWTPETPSYGWAAAAAGLAALHLGVRAVLLSSRHEELADLQLVPAAVFAGVGAVLAFDGPVLSLLLAGEAVAVAVVARRLGRSLIEVFGHIGFAMVATAEFILMVDGTPEGLPLLNGPALSRMAMLTLATGLAVFLDRTSGSGEFDGTLRLAYAGYGLLGVLALLLVELSQINQGAVTAGWGVVGLAMTVAGTLAMRKKLRLVGVGTLLLAVGKLFMTDLASVDPVWRILLFAGFGLALLIVGYWMSNDE